MTKQLIGSVTQAEKEDVVRLHERRTALRELLLTLNSPYLSEGEKRTLAGRIVEEYVKASSLFERWWREAARKYNWPSKEHGSWMVDFETNDVYHQPSGGGPPAPDEPLPFAPEPARRLPLPLVDPGLSVPQTDPLPPPGG
jgi:CXXX repeat modification system protein